MGNWNSGRRPAPTALKVLRGNPGKRPLPAHEPTLPAAPADFDTPPDELTGNPAAIKEWSRVVPLLRVSGIIGTAERSALIALCIEWARWLDAQQKLHTLRMLIKGKRDEPIANPYIRIADHALTQCQRLWTELGLTPSSRVRLSALPASVATPLSKWANDLT